MDDKSILNISYDQGSDRLQINVTDEQGRSHVPAMGDIDRRNTLAKKVNDFITHSASGTNIHDLLVETLRLAIVRQQKEGADERSLALATDLEGVFANDVDMSIFDYADILRSAAALGPGEAIAVSSHVVVTVDGEGRLASLQADQALNNNSHAILKGLQTVEFPVIESNGTPDQGGQNP